MTMQRNVSTVVVLCIGIIGCSSQLSAQQAVQSSVQPNTTKPGGIETSASRVYTFVKGTGMGHDHGVEGKLASGWLTLGAQNNAGQFVIDLTSFDSDTKRARQVVGIKGDLAGWMRKQVNKEIQSAKVLDTQKYPKATYNITSSRRVGDDQRTKLPIYELVGELDLHGVKRPIKFNVAVEQTKGWLRLRGQFQLVQSSFGIKPISKGLGAVGVKDQLIVHGDIWLAPNAQSTASLSQPKMSR